MDVLGIALVVLAALASLIARSLQRRRCAAPTCAASDCPLAQHCRPGRHSVPVLLAGLLVGGVASTAAENPPMGDLALSADSGASSSAWHDRDRLLGDLGGLRPELAELGMELELVSVDEGFSHATGGDGDHRSTYHGLTDLVLGLDTEAAGWWSGGRFTVDLQNVRGGDISACVGDHQGVSNIVGEPGTRFVEYHYEHVFAGDRARVKVGKQDANADFVATASARGFLNSSFGLQPTVPIPTFPTPALGLMAGVALSRSSELKAGLWDGSPDLGSGCVGTAFDGVGGSVSAIELETRLAAIGDRAAVLKAGLWHHTAVASSAKAHPGEEAASGVYASWDQAVWQGQSTAVHLFAQGSWTEPRTSATRTYLGGGLVVHRPFADVGGSELGVALAHAELGELAESAHGGGSETVLEAYYAHPLKPWLTVKQDLQLLRSSHGHDTEALVVAVRMETVF